MRTFTIVMNSMSLAILAFGVLGNAIAMALDFYIILFAAVIATANITAMVSLRDKKKRR